MLVACLLFLIGIAALAGLDGRPQAAWYRIWITLDVSAWLPHMFEHELVHVAGQILPAIFGQPGAPGAAVRRDPPGGVHDAVHHQVCGGAGAGRGPHLPVCDRQQVCCIVSIPGICDKAASLSLSKRHATAQPGE